MSSITRCLVAALCLFAWSGSSLAQRVPWTSSRIAGTPEPPKPYTTEPAYANLKFREPVELLPLGASGRMMLLEVGGKLFTFEDRPDVEQADLMFDVSAGHDDFHRAFAVAPHPEFERTREIFVCYALGPTARPDGTRLSRFKLTADNPPALLPESEKILLTWASGGHNGCAIRFDAQGYLYFSAGDGARPYPPDEYDVGQKLSDLRSTICRIDINNRDPGLAYAIPVDNPFVGTPNARPEIWAFGFRNPWRFSIDHTSGALMCGDVGWELWELVHRVERGGNYGWSTFEGPQPIRSDLPVGPGKIIPPVVAYPHTEGLSITGGYHCRSSSLPELDGAYIYGDYVTGLVWGLRMKDGQAAWNEVLAETGLRIITFTPAPGGDFLVVSFDGSIHRLVPNRQSEATDFPTVLSRTGLFSDTVSLKPERGVYRYEPIRRAYAGATNSEFHIAVPGSETIEVNRQQRQWKYPAGTVVCKTISDAASNNKRIETQILHFDGVSWQPYSYRWNLEQTDATLVAKEGQSTDVEGRSYRIHSRSECRACHSNQAGGAISFSLANLDLSPGGQFDQLVDLNIVSRRPPANWNIKSMQPTDDQRLLAGNLNYGVLEQHARSYLAANCAHCHCRGGGGTVALDLYYQNNSKDIFAIDFPATQGQFGIDDARVIKPGEPESSVLMYRLSTAGVGHMPKLWQRDNDLEGLELVRRWIKGMSSEAADLPEGTTQIALRRALEIARLPDSNSRVQAAREELAKLDETNVNRGLFERYLPTAERTQRLGSDFDRTSILAARGDASRGERWYWSNAAAQCRNCHQIVGRGQSVGPSLDQIGARRTKASLLESLVDPSRQIDAKYRTLSVMTIDGEAYSGLVQDVDANPLVLTTADGKEHRIATEDIEQRQFSPNSLMPSGWVEQLTRQQLLDLLAYLESLQ
ncbi:MAG TPA: hypothetical protein DDW52_20755 [Planctomycetaceae bacterium]|nr:hypothetical protein [Planctomycetaceae bacterium]